MHNCRTRQCSEIPLQGFPTVPWCCSPEIGQVHQRQHLGEWFYDSPVSRKDWPSSISGQTKILEYLLSRLVEPLKLTCTTKVKANSVKQEYEKQDELKRFVGFKTVFNLKKSVYHLRTWIKQHLKDIWYNFGRSAMRAVAALLTIPGADKHPQLNEFVTQVITAWASWSLLL